MKMMLYDILFVDEKEKTYQRVYLDIQYANVYVYSCWDNSIIGIVNDLERYQKVYAYAQRQENIFKDSGYKEIK